MIFVLVFREKAVSLQPDSPFWSRNISNVALS